MGGRYQPDLDHSADRSYPPTFHQPPAPQHPPPNYKEGTDNPQYAQVNKPQYPYTGGGSAV